MPRPLVWLLVAGVAVTAYIVGAKAGTARYREISGTAKKVWDDPALKKVRARTYKKVEKAAKKVAKKIS